ncbi:porin family protein [Fulvivirga sp. M361]|uniref:porin family protein n=1 Tax=Fulvivirga sp. M361 TaxID=2594266 RepID=UPI00162A71D0|nr:porin family protein [Fulvivirga sp. M361]
MKTTPMVNKLLSASLLVLGMVLSGYAQNTCTQSLRSAQTAYDEGQLQRIPVLLESCLNSRDGFTDEEKTLAYRLLTLAHIFMDEPQKADEAMLALLKFNPQFEINEGADPAELINLYGTFRTTPILSYGIKGGGNITLVEVLNSFGVHNLEGTDGEYQKDPGFQVGFSVEIPLTKKLTLNPELYLMGNFNTYVNNFGNIDSLNRFIRKQEFTFSHLTASLPVTLQYRLIDNSKLNPYVFAGASANYALSSTLNGQTNSSNESFEGPTEDLMEQRFALNFNAILGGGIKLKVGKNQLLIEARFNYGILNQLDEDKRYANQELLFNYGYIHDDIKLHSIALSVGYLLPLYKPKKL